MISYGGLFSEAVLRVQAAPFVNRLAACAGVRESAFTQETRWIMVRRSEGQKYGRLYNMFEGNPDKRGGE
jgi:hypothetical protein